MDDLVPDFPVAENPPIPSISPARLTKARVAVSLSFFVAGAGFASWVSRIPAIQLQLGLSKASLGLALFGTAVGALFGFPLASLASAKCGNRIATALFAALFCLMLAAIPFANGFWSLALILAGFGLSHGGIDVAMNANGVEVEHRYGRSIMSTLHGMYSLGGLVGSAVGAVIARFEISPTIHLRVAGLCLATVSALAYAWMVSARPTGKSDHPVFAIPSKSLVALGTIVICSFLCEGAMGDWSGLYLRDTLKTSEGFAGLGFVVFSVMMTLARFSGDIVITRFGPSRVLRTAGTIAALGFGAALLIGQPTVALIGFGCIGLGMSTVAPIAFSAAGKAPGTSPGSAIAAVSTMGYGGFLIGPPLIGVLAEQTSLRLALGLVALLACGIALLAGRAEPSV